MASPENFGQLVADWGRDHPAVAAVVLIGSRERTEGGALPRADRYSDWDFHLITGRPEAFAGPGWTRSLPGTELLAYVARTAAIGGVPRISAVFKGAEADFVLLPIRVLRRMQLGALFGRHRRPGWTRSRYQDLAIVIRPGWKFLVGEDRWGKFYRRAVEAVPDPRLSDAAARQLADLFVCNYVWTLRKLGRGELRAAQRMIHRELAETNFRLWHELRLRRGEPSFPEARRLEWTAPPAELGRLSVDASLDSAQQTAALHACARSCAFLMRELLGEAWRWPEVG